MLLSYEAPASVTLASTGCKFRMHAVMKQPRELNKLHIALTFWDGWVHSRNHGWPPGPIALADWPRLARSVAADLAADHEISEAKVLENFDFVAHPRLNERVQILAERLRERDEDQNAME